MKEKKSDPAALLFEISRRRVVLFHEIFYFSRFLLTLLPNFVITIFVISDAEFR